MSVRKDCAPNCSAVNRHSAPNNRCPNQPRTRKIRTANAVRRSPSWVALLGCETHPCQLRYTNARLSMAAIRALTDGICPFTISFCR